MNKKIPINQPLSNELWKYSYCNTECTKFCAIGWIAKCILEFEHKKVSEKNIDIICNNSALYFSDEPSVLSKILNIDRYEIFEFIKKYDNIFTIDLIECLKVFILKHNDKFIWIEHIDKNNNDKEQKK